MTPDQLRRIAEAATPGPWELDKCDNRVHVDYVRAPNDENLIAPICAVSSPGPNAEFIATFDPERVLELLDQIEQLQAVVRDSHDECTYQTRLAAVEKLHQKRYYTARMTAACTKCETAWPCDDIKAARGE